MVAAVFPEAASLVTWDVLVAYFSDAEEGREECSVGTLLKPQ